MKKSRFIAIRNQADTSTLELYFLDLIQETYDWYAGTSSPVQDTINQVNYYKPSNIKVTIDSEGGDAATGIALYNFLKRCDAKVEIEIIGLAGSIASVIAMAANKGKLRIAKNAFMMIHNAEGVVGGTSDEIRKGADLVDLYTSQIVDIYVQRTGKTTDEITALMANGDYWMTGDQAVEQGFADSTFNENVNVISIAARLNGHSEYKNIPAQIRAQLTPEKPEEGSGLTTIINTQFTEMKKFFTEIVNSIKGIKPQENVSVTNQIADAMAPQFDKIADEIDSQITASVKERLKGDKFKTELTNQLTTFLNTDEGKTIITNLVKTSVDAATAELKQKNEELEQEITNMKGSASQGSKTGDEGTKVIGSFK